MKPNVIPLTSQGHFVPQSYHNIVLGMPLLKTSSFMFCGQQLFLLTQLCTWCTIFITIWVTSRILTTCCDLWDMVKKANCLLASFLCVGDTSVSDLESPPLQFSTVLTFLSYHTEIAFNKVFRSNWSSQRHTGIVHLVANLDSLYNLVYCHYLYVVCGS